MSSRDDSGGCPGCCAAWRTSTWRCGCVGLAAAFVITVGYGLVTPDTVVHLEYLREIASVPIDAAEPPYRLPHERGCRPASPQTAEAEARLRVARQPC